MGEGFPLLQAQADKSANTEEQCPCLHTSLRNRRRLIASDTFSPQAGRVIALHLHCTAGRLFHSAGKHTLLKHSAQNYGLLLHRQLFTSERNKSELIAILFVNQFLVVMEPKHESPIYLCVIR